MILKWLIRYLYTQVPVIANRNCAQQYANAGLNKSPTQFGYEVVCAEHQYDGVDACQGKHTE